MLKKLILFALFFKQVRDFLILSFGTAAPHALSCPPPEPPNSEETADTNFPRWVLHVGEPRTDIAYIPLSTRSL